MKRIFVCILCLALAASLCVPAFAAEDGDDEKSELLRAVDIPESLVMFISEEVGHMDDAYEYLSGKEPDGKGKTWGGGWPLLYGRLDVVLEDMECKSIFECSRLEYAVTFRGNDKPTRWRSWAFYSYSGGKGRTLMIVNEYLKDGDGEPDYSIAQMGGSPAPLIAAVSALRVARGDDIEIVVGCSDISAHSIDITDLEDQATVVYRGSDYDGQVIPIRKYLGWWQRNQIAYLEAEAIADAELEAQKAAYRRANGLPEDAEVQLYGGQPAFTPVPFAPMKPLYQKTPPGAELLVLAGSLLLLALSALLRRRRS